MGTHLLQNLKRCIFGGFVRQSKEAQFKWGNTYRFCQPKGDIFHSLGQVVEDQVPIFYQVLWQQRHGLHHCWIGARTARIRSLNQNTQLLCTVKIIAKATNLSNLSMLGNTRITRCEVSLERPLWNQSSKPFLDETQHHNKAPRVMCKNSPDKQLQWGCTSFSRPQSQTTELYRAATNKMLGFIFLVPCLLM